MLVEGYANTIIRTLLVALIAWIAVYLDGQLKWTGAELFVWPLPQKRLNDVMSYPAKI
jgi:hypothetical protein